VITRRAYASDADGTIHPAVHGHRTFALFALATAVVTIANVAIRRDADIIDAPGVLLVHEDLSWLRAASDVLQRAGFEVVPAVSGATALHHVNEGFRPAVLVAGLRMAGIGGIELSTVIHDVSPATAIVLVAASAPHAADVAEAPSAMMLVEPFALDDLTACVRSGLRRDTNIAFDDVGDDVTHAPPDATIPVDMSWSLVAAAVLISAGWVVVQLLRSTRP